jgi:two-component system, NtrC family, sensor kinase
MHRLLQRQLKRHLSHLGPLPAEWDNFLAAVDDAYCQFESDHSMLERSLELSSEELLQSNTQLQTLLNEVEEQVEQRTRELACTNLDLTQALVSLQNTQVQLIQAEKMSSLGQLVAGIAHEINNPVNFIHGNIVYLQDYTKNLLSIIQLCLECYPNPPVQLQTLIEDVDLDYIRQDLPKLMNSIDIGTQRIKEIVLSLRNFSRMDEADYKLVNLHEGIESTLMMLEHRLRAQPDRSAIEVVKHYGDLPTVECYAGQINQVFMNLLANAIDAVEERDIHRTKEENLAHPSQITIYTETIENHTVVVRFVDNGPGIPLQTQQKLFDPFFTTKPIGKGTGMGLSISYQIITERHRGTIQCLSSIGEGTEFVIKIPVIQF